MLARRRPDLRGAVDAGDGLRDAAQHFSVEARSCATPPAPNLPQGQRSPLPPAQPGDASLLMGLRQPAQATSLPLSPLPPSVPPQAAATRSSHKAAVAAHKAQQQPSPTAEKVQPSPPAQRPQQPSPSPHKPHFHRPPRHSSPRRRPGSGHQRSPSGVAPAVAPEAQQQPVPHSMVTTSSGVAAPVAMPATRGTVAARLRSEVAMAQGAMAPAAGMQPGAAGMQPWAAPPSDSDLSQMACQFWSGIQQALSPQALDVQWMAIKHAVTSC